VLVGVGCACAFLSSFPPSFLYNPFHLLLTLPTNTPSLFTAGLRLRRPPPLHHPHPMGPLPRILLHVHVPLSHLLVLSHPPPNQQLAYAYVDLLPSNILTQWGRYLEGPLAREAAKLRAFHAAFSLPPSLDSSPATATAAAAASAGPVAPFQRLEEEEEALPRVVLRAAAATAGVEEEEAAAPLSVPFALST